MRYAEETQFALLQADDPPPVEWVNRDSNASVLLLCEHAGNEIPQSLNQLGLTKAQLDTHVGLDVGAAAVARELAALLQAPLILQCFSRLVIDCNRPFEADDSIPETSDGITIPANLNLNIQEKQSRQSEIFKPLDDAINEGLAKHPRKAVFSIHSFTPQMQNQQRRPWHAGFLTRTDQTTGNAFISFINAQNPDLCLGLNQPYSIDSDSDWFIPQYAEPRDLNHSLIEIRNDQLLHENGIHCWAGYLASAIKSIMEQIQ